MCEAAAAAMIGALCRTGPRSVIVSIQKKNVQQLHDHIPQSIFVPQKRDINVDLHTNKTVSGTILMYSLNLRWPLFFRSTEYFERWFFKAPTRFCLVFLGDNVIRTKSNGSHDCPIRLAIACACKSITTAYNGNSTCYIYVVLMEEHSLKRRFSFFHSIEIWSESTESWQLVIDFIALIDFLHSSFFTCYVFLCRRCDQHKCIDSLDGGFADAKHKVDV